MAIANEGDSQSYAYTGGMQSFTAPFRGVYKLEVWGATGAWAWDGSATSTASSLGGYAAGYRMMDKGETIYICCGKYGEYAQGTTYNGGGQGAQRGGTWGGQGGGATHMATVSGTLAQIGSGNKAKVLLVAGGGGGSPSCFPWYMGFGGNGGGETGQTSTNYAGKNVPGQTSGYAFGQGQNASANSWWSDDTWEGNCVAGGGGGGWYGGYAEGDQYDGGTGGSGYIGGVPSFAYNGTTYAPGWTTGVSSDKNTNGHAKITYIVKGELPIVFNGTKIQKLIVNGMEVTSLIFNGTKLFFGRMMGRFAAWLSGLTEQGSSGRAGTAGA